VPIRKRSINSQGNYTDYKHLNSNYNQSNINNYSHQENTPTNFNLKTITLEDIDKAVYQEFNNRFTARHRQIPIILLDAELTSLQNQNYLQFDQDKKFLNLPFFTMWRKETKPLYKTNPAFKQVIYSTPKRKANGIVIEEYISEGPRSYLLVYEFKFITNFREYTNQMEQQFGHYFRNKANMIICSTERFPIRPSNQDTIGEVEIVNREDVEQRTLYVTTYSVRVWGFTRDLANMQKRERPNRILFDMIISDSSNKICSCDVFTLNPQVGEEVEQLEMDIADYPGHPIICPDTKLSGIDMSLGQSDTLTTEDGQIIITEGTGVITTEDGIIIITEQGVIVQGEGNDIISTEGPI